MSNSNRLSARFSSLPNEILLKILKLLPLSDVLNTLALLKSGYRDPNLRPILEPLIHSQFQYLAAHLQVDLSQANNQLDYHLDPFGFYAKQLNVDLRFYRAPSAPVIVNQQATLTCLQLRDALFVVPSELRNLQENSEDFAQILSSQRHLSSEPQQCGIRPGTYAISVREDSPNKLWSRTSYYPLDQGITVAHAHQTHLLVDASTVFADIIVHNDLTRRTLLAREFLTHALSKFKGHSGVVPVRVGRDFFFDPTQLLRKLEQLSSSAMKQKKYLVLFHEAFIKNILKAISSTQHSGTVLADITPDELSADNVSWVFDSLYSAEERAQLKAMHHRFSRDNGQPLSEHFLFHSLPNDLQGYLDTIIENHELINRFFLWELLYCNSFSMHNVYSPKLLQAIELSGSSFLHLSASNQAIFREMLSQFLDTYDHGGHLKQYMVHQLLKKAADGREINTGTYGSSYAYIEEYFTGIRPLSDSSESYLADLLQLDRFTKLGISFNRLIRQLPLDTLKEYMFYPLGYISQFKRAVLRDNEHLPYSYGMFFTRWFGLMGDYLADRIIVPPVSVYFLIGQLFFWFSKLFVKIAPQNPLTHDHPYENFELVKSLIRIILFSTPFVLCNSGYISPLFFANVIVTSAVFYLTSFVNSLILNLFQSIKFGIGETHIKRYEDYQFAKTLFKALTISTTLLGFACLTATVPLTLTVPAMILYVLVNQDPIYSAPHSVSLNQFYRNVLSGVSAAKTGISNWLVSKKLFLLGASQPKETFSEQIQDKVKAFQMALETKLWSLKPNEFQGKTKTNLLDEILNTVTKVPNALTLVKQGHEKTRQYQMNFSTCQAQQSVPWTFLTQWTAAPNPAPQPEHSWNESEKACFLLGCEIAEAPSHRLDWALKTLP